MLISPYTQINKKKIKVKAKETVPIIPIFEEQKPVISFKFVQAEKIREPLKLLAFIEWLAMPTQERKLKTQKEFATEIGLNVDTLADWKKLSGFWDEVAIHRNQYFRKYTTSISYGLMQRAKTGDPRAAELFLTLFENYNKKTGIEDLTPARIITDEEKAKIDHALKNIGLASIIAKNKN